ncbi:MAG TPA: C45 family autoproteolytic acyltransferase/hydrolase [bacterium]|nr:C45 family autoproteolytic acyltransferase/hydrolase [bacterium]
MKKTGARAIFTIILFILLASIRAEAKVIATSGAGRLEEVDGVRVAYLSGTHYEMGLQHGVLLKDDIKALMSFFFENKKTIFGASFDDLDKGAKTLLKNIPAEYVEEMKGIAEGSGVDFKQILYANTFLDVVSASWSGVKPSCTNFAALPRASLRGEIVHGRNLDWTADEAVTKSNVVFHYEPKGGFSFTTMGWTGIAGTLTGFNYEQISVGEMTSMSTEAQLDGTPIMIQLRALLERSKTLDDAYKVLAEMPRTTGYNVLVTDGKAGDAFVVEMSAKSIVKFKPENDMIFRTNHYVDKKLSKTQMKYFYMYYSGKQSDSFLRYDRLNELLTSNKGKIDAKLAMSFLGDKWDGATKDFNDTLKNSICASNTLQSAVILPDSGEIYVALGKAPAPDRGFVRLKFPVTENKKK